MSERAVFCSLSAGSAVRSDAALRKAGRQAAKLVGNHCCCAGSSFLQTPTIRRPTASTPTMCSLSHSNGNNRMRNSDSTVPHAVPSAFDAVAAPLTTSMDVIRMDLESQLKWFEAWAVRSTRALDEAQQAEGSAREDFHSQKQIVRGLRTDVDTACARLQYRHGSDDGGDAEASEALAAVEREALAAEAQFLRLEVELEEATSRAFAAAVTRGAAVKTAEGLRRMLEASKIGIEDLPAMIETILKSSNVAAKQLMAEMAQYKETNELLLFAMKNQRKNKCPLWDREVESELEIELGWAAYNDWHKKNEMEIWSCFVENEAEIELQRLGQIHLN